MINLRGVQLGFGGPALLERVSLSVERGERICLLGRNGAGKSTLMRLIAGEIRPEAGQITVRQGAVITRLPQEVPGEIAGSVFDVISSGLGDIGDLLRQYHHLTARLATEGDAGLAGRLSAVQHRLEAAHGWGTEQRVEAVISRLSLDADLAFPNLSGGLKRRVLLARALVAEPDLLLLDEPTNHLDIAAIDWLETFLLGFGGALLFVTHDRVFLQRLATRIIELDRGQLTDWPGDYRNFLRRKEERHNAEEKANARFDKKLAQEEVWIRQGIKARRTRNEGRVRSLETMRAERAERRVEQGKARIALHGAERPGKLVVEARNISYAWDDNPLIKDFSTMILRGDKVGIIGPNGVGKTTLLHLLFPFAANTAADGPQESGGLAKAPDRGLLPRALRPDAGEIRLGTRLEIAYFDQMRGALDEEASVRDNVSPGSDRVVIEGRPRHVIGYLQDFLFSPDRVRQPVKALSGGERNRLLLAKLFTHPANVLVMDEPTNDLDRETLELLEELLLDYKGTLLLVSHDRAFLDSVVTSTLVFEGKGRVAEYVGGYEDWVRQRPSAESAEKKPTPPRPAPEKPEQKPKKLSYNEERERAALPVRLDGLETELNALHAEMSGPGFYRGARERIAATTKRLEAVKADLEEGYQRWEALEALANSLRERT